MNLERMSNLLSVQVYTGYPALSLNMPSLHILHRPNITISKKKNTFNYYFGILILKEFVGSETGDSHI